MVSDKSCCEVVTKFDISICLAKLRSVVSDLAARKIQSHDLPIMNNLDKKLGLLFASLASRRYTNKNASSKLSRSRDGEWNHGFKTKDGKISDKVASDFYSNFLVVINFVRT